MKHVLVTGAFGNVGQNTIRSLIERGHDVTAFDLDTALAGAKALIKDPHKGFYLIAETMGEIVGQLMVTNEWRDWRNKYFLWIQSVYVREDFRRKGIFSALYHHLNDLARYKKNVAGLRLYVEKNNETARQVYEDIGMIKSHYEIYEVLLKGCANRFS